MYKMDIVKHKLNLNRDKEVYLIEIDSLKEKISDNEKIISEQQKTILEYKEQCATLQKTLQNITASKNTIVRPKIIKKITNINNIIINMLPITQEWMAEQCRLMTKEHYASPELLSKYLCEKILKDRSICTDVTRGTLRYKNEDNIPFVDKKGTKVTENFITNLEPKSRNIIPEIKNDIIKENLPPEYNTKRFRDLHIVKDGIDKTINGEKSELGSIISKEIPKLF